jgi:hypothetical protein
MTVVATPPPPTTDAWPAVHRLLALQRSRNSLEQLAARTNSLARLLTTRTSLGSSIA